MGKYQDNELVYVAPSPIHGRGLYASRPLAAGQLIGIYHGPETDVDGPHVLWIEDESGNSWTGFDGENEMRFMNHSGQPNAEMDGLNCHARVAIEADAEITIDYGWDDS